MKLGTLTIGSAFPLAVLLSAVLFASTADAQNVAAGPLVEISRPTAVPAGCNTGFTVFGTFSTDNATEPVVAANPANPRNVAAGWFQGVFQDMIAAVSFNEGQDWQRDLIPLTVCSGGPFLATADPWLSFGPSGDLSAVAITWSSNSASNREIVVSKSADGGLHWSPALVIPGSGTVDPPADHPSLTSDPTDARFVYAIWNGANSPHSTAAVFARTTDGGLTWEAARPIVQTAEQTFIQFNQIFVLPNGTLVDIFEFFEQQPNKPITFTNLQLLRSGDHGQTWSAPANAVTMTPLYRPNGETLVVDPNTGRFVHDLTNPSFAVDGRNGNLYAVWEDGRFSGFQNNDIAFSMSADAGFTWSAPIRVNQTPVTIGPADRQAFFPAVAVAADGTIGVSYYDFRFNNPNPGPGLPTNTDYWLAQCHPSSTSAASDPACWGNEIRLTDTSFNLQAVVPVDPAGDIFLGDYFGLAAAGHDFVSAFTAVDSQNVTGIFARRVGP